MAEPQFDFGKGVVMNEAAELSNIANTLKEMQKPTPKVETPTPAPVVDSTEKKEDAAEVKAEVPIHTKSEIDAPEAKPEVKETKGKGKKKDGEKALDTIVAQTKDGKEVSIKQFDKTAIERLNSSLEDDGEKKPIATKEEKGEKGDKVEKPTKEAKYEIPKDIQERLERAEYIESVANSPTFAVAEKLFKDGKTSVKDVIKDFDLNDYDTMNNKDVYEISLKKQGLEGDELAEAIEEFESLPAYKQKITTNPIRSELKNAANEKNNIFSSQPTKEQVREFQKIQKQAATEGMNRLDELVEKTVTEGYFGFPVSKEDLEVVRNEVLNNTIVAADGKSYDVDATFTKAINNPSIVRKAIKYAREVGRFEGYEDFIKERIRVDKNDFVHGETGGKSEYQFAADVVKTNA